MVRRRCVALPGLAISVAVTVGGCDEESGARTILSNLSGAAGDHAESAGRTGGAGRSGARGGAGRSGARGGAGGAGVGGLAGDPASAGEGGGKGEARAGTGGRDGRGGGAGTETAGTIGVGGATPEDGGEAGGGGVPDEGGSAGNGGVAGAGGSAPDPCNPSPCRHGARCLALGDAPSCACPEGYSGPRCDVGHSTCDNGGCDYRDVAVAQGTVCAVRTNDTVECWGRFKQGGRATTLTSGWDGLCGIDPVTEYPWCTVQLAGHLPVAPTQAIAPGRRHACAVQGGTTVCWYYGVSYEPKVPSVVTPPANSDFVSLVSGDELSCGLRSDGSRACWGDDWSSQSAGPYTQLELGDEDHLCALTSAQTISCSTPDHCGDDGGTYRSVALGKNFCTAVRADGTLALWDAWGRQTLASPPAGNFTQVSATNEMACAVGTDGTIACWGGDNHGAVLPRRRPFVDASVGAGGTCAIRPDRTLDCWSSDTRGGYTRPPWGEFRKVVVGNQTGCALATDGTVHCFGMEGDPPSTLPGTYIDIAAEGGSGQAGDERICVITSEHELSCWGARPSVTLPAGSYAKVYVAGDGVCALDTDFHAHCAGGPAAPAGQFAALTLASRSMGSTVCGLTFAGGVVCTGYPLVEGAFDEICLEVENDGISLLARRETTVSRVGDFSFVVPGTYSSLGCSSSRACLVGTDGTLACK